MTKIEFNTFDAENCKQQFGRNHKNHKNLTFRAKGSVTISCQSAADLGLKDGGHIVFLQDKKYPSDWYIQMTDSEKGFEVTKTKSNGYTFASYVLMKAVLQSVDIYDTNFHTVSFPLNSCEHGLMLDVKHYKYLGRK